MRWIVGAVVSAAVTFPVWGFELTYQYGIRGEHLPELPSGTPASLFEQALWLATGEEPGAGVERLWVGNYLRTEPFQAGAARGRRALVTVARAIVYADPERRLSALEHSLRTGAVGVWLSRHAEEADLKRLLLRSSPFGRGALGGADAAEAYFGRPIEGLTVGEVALLAALPLSPARLDPACQPLRARERRAWVLTRLRDAHQITPDVFRSASGESVEALPRREPCPDQTSRLAEPED